MSEVLHIFGLKQNEATEIYVTLADPTDADIRVNTPAFAAGDARISTDGGAWGNMATPPTVNPAGDVGVRLQLSAGEMNGANILIVLQDQTGPETWSALTISINTRTVDVDDLVRSTTPANALDISATGEAGLDFDNVKDATGATTLANITIPTVTTLTGHTAQTGDSFARLGAPITASISADIAVIDAIVDAILVDTNALDTDWANGGRLDLLLDAVVADVASLDDTKIPDTISLAAINAEVDTALNTAIPGAPTADSINQRIRTLDLLTEAAGDGDLAAILADTDELQGDWVNAGRLDALLDAIIATIGSATGVAIDLTQAISEGQAARTIGGSLEVTEATERNLISVVGGVRTLYRSNGTTVLVARTQTSTSLSP